MDDVVTDDAVVITESPARVAAIEEPTPRWKQLVRGIVDRPVLVAALLTLFGLPLQSVVPHQDLDSSWKLGLHMAIDGGIPFGHGVLFTYGPLGFLTVPHDIRLDLLAYSLLFVVASSFALYMVLMLWLRTWLSPGRAAAVGFGLAWVAGVLEPAELSGIAFVLWTLWFIDRERRGVRTPLWVLATLGASSSVLMLGKLSMAPLAFGLVVLALLASNRLVRLATVIGSMAVAVVGFWMLAGQPIGDLKYWFTESLGLLTGYADAMQSQDMLWAYPIVLVPLVVVLGIGAVSAIRRSERSWPFVVVMAVSFWLFLRAGFVRLDPLHGLIVLAVATLLLVVLPWEQGRVRLALGALGFSFLVLLVGVGDASHTSLRPRVVAAREILRVGREFVDSSYHEQRLEAARTENREHPATVTGESGPNPSDPEPVSDEVLRALDPDSVQADPIDVAQVDALGLRWDPVPIFQMYSSYTAKLDDINAAALEGDDAPATILDRKLSLDSRNPAWLSPQYEVAKVCNYEEVASDRTWQALQKTTDLCGQRASLGKVTASAGEKIEVPEPSDPDSMVVARFDVTPKTIDRVLGLVFRPFDKVRVQVDDESYFFIPKTGGGEHIVHQPAEKDGRRLPFGAIDDQTLTFDDVQGDVEVEFYEVPLG